MKQLVVLLVCLVLCACQFKGVNQAISEELWEKRSAEAPGKSGEFLFPTSHVLDYESTGNSDKLFLTIDDAFPYSDNCAHLTGGTYGGWDEWVILSPVSVAGGGTVAMICLPRVWIDVAEKTEFWFDGVAVYPSGITQDNTIVLEVETDYPELRTALEEKYYSYVRNHKAIFVEIDLPAFADTKNLPLTLNLVYEVKEAKIP